MKFQKDSNTESVCAIIVTWNSPDEVQRILPSVASQVKEVVIVDNGSSEGNIKKLQETILKFRNVDLIRNPENLGIGLALNRGAEYALENGYLWMLTLDDNGKPDKGMVSGLLEAYSNLSKEEQNSTAIVAPNYANLKGLVYTLEKPKFVLTTVTSGQLVKTAVWREVGGYKEDFFISCVDHEFSFRVGKAGYKILLVSYCILSATAGPNPEIRSFFGRKIIVPNYNPDRYYYTYRNSIYLYKKYFSYATFWILDNMLSNIWSVVKILLFEKQKCQKIAMILRGLFDGMRGKYGKL